MLKKPSYKWKVNILAFIITAIFAILYIISATQAFAQSITDTKITYTLTSQCELTVVFPYDLSENYISTFGGTGSSRIEQYLGFHPATTTSEGSKTGYTNGTVGDWVAEWQQGFNDPPVTQTPDGNSVTWNNIDNDGSTLFGTHYWYWSFPDGNTYFAEWKVNGTDDCDPVNSATAEISPLTFNTRLLDATATGTASTSISIDVDYFLDTAEYTANNRPDAVYVAIVSNTDPWQGFQVTSARRLILPLSDGTESVNLPLEWVQDTGGFPDGDYFAYINFWNINRDTFTFSETALILSFTITGGQVTSTTLIESYDGTTLPPIAQYQECSLTNIGGCFQNALIFTFVPSADAFDQFTSLYERIENKPPFGYVTSLKNALSGVSDSASAAFDFGAIPFQTQIFDPFKAIMIIGLWLLYALFFMGRLNKLDI